MAAEIISLLQLSLIFHAVTACALVVLVGIVLVDR